MPDAALDGIKVLDLTHHIAGPYCTKLLADFGAEVTRIERPGTGDHARQIGPFVHDQPHPDKSLLFLYLNTNKHSVTLNLKHDTGKQILTTLVQDADLVVENFSPRVLPSLGLDYEALKRLNPRLVMVSISNFGQTGPYRDYKATDIASDNRIAPGNNVLSEHRFSLPPGCDSGTIKATLLYRPIPLNLARQRGWESKDHVIAASEQGF